MFRSSARTHLLRRLGLTRALAWFVAITLAGGIEPAPPQAAASDDPPQGKANPGDQQKTPRENGEVEQKLLLDLESAWDAFADHADRHRLDREFAAAVRRLRRESPKGRTQGSRGAPGRL